MEKEFLNVSFEIKATKEDEDYFYFEGYASTFGNVDEGWDKVLPGAFKETLKKYNGPNKLPALWQHDRNEPIGVFTELEEDELGLFVRCRLPKADTFVSGRVIPQVKVGSIKAMSIGYYALKFSWETEESTGREIRNLETIELVETSLVTFPMNTMAVITDFKGKSLDELSERDLETALRKGVALSQKQAKTVIKALSLLRRDAEEKTRRDAENVKAISALVDSLKTL